MSKKGFTIRPRIQCIPLTENCKTYSQFYRENWGKVQKFFFYDLRDHHEAEDIAQDVFLRVWVHLFKEQESVDLLPLAQRENLTYHVKNIIWSVRTNRVTTLDKRIDVTTESMMYVNPNSTETPLEALVNRGSSVGDPFTEIRFLYFMEDLKATFLEPKISDVFLHLFLGFSHDEAQKKAGVTHGTFYRRYKDNKVIFDDLVKRHFSPEERNVSS